MSLDAAAVAVPDSSSSGAANASTPPRLGVELSDSNVQVTSIPEQLVVLTNNRLVLTNDSQPANASYANLVAQDDGVLTQQEPTHIPLVENVVQVEGQQDAGNTTAPQSALQDPLDLTGIF